MEPRRPVLDDELLLDAIFMLADINANVLLIATLLKEALGGEDPEADG